MSLQSHLKKDGQKDEVRSKNARMVSLTAGATGSEKISVFVDEKEVRPDFSNFLGKRHWKAMSAGERPGFDMLLRGPAGMPVKVEFQHDHDILYRKKIAGNEGGKLENKADCCGLKEVKTGAWKLTLPEENNGEVSLKFSTVGLSARHVFKVAFGNVQELYYCYEIEYTAFRFIRIPYNGANYIGYGTKNASWGLPELKTFIEKFATLHFDETKKKPYIGNKGLQDGVSFEPHRGISHAGGYGVDIDFGVDTGNDIVGKGRYNKQEHKKQIQRYLKCGANYVLTGNENLAKELGPSVHHDDRHITHDHVNVPHK